MKIVGFEHPTAEGVVVKLDDKFALNGGIEADEWWVSWDKLVELINTLRTVGENS